MKTLDEPVIGMATSGHSWLFHKWRRSKPIGMGTGFEDAGGWESLCGTVFVPGIAEGIPSKGDKVCKRCFKNR